VAHSFSQRTLCVFAGMPVDESRHHSSVECFANLNLARISFRGFVAQTL